MFEIINTKTGEKETAKTYSEALNIATVKHNRIKRDKGEAVKFRIIRK